jgi:hypothetical protein
MGCLINCPASGHLYTIKSNFNSTDEIRNLEYEYDLMDNVTQRQNHISGLSEGFTYECPVKRPAASRDLMR